MEMALIYLYRYLHLQNSFSFIDDKFDTADVIMIVTSVSRIHV